ncbi:MAG: hypothetical protein H7338_20075 [Candidatus Sericytochromatia bacterium]|nr:hypothetical protein [Candidatus Sericytochromatia bacterium]
MEIKLAASMRVAHGSPSDSRGHQTSSLPPPIDSEQQLIKLNLPLRASRPAIDFLSMTALERTLWEIRARSETALLAQTGSLDSFDVAALLAG